MPLDPAELVPQVIIPGIPALEFGGSLQVRERTRLFGFGSLKILKGWNMGIGLDLIQFFLKDGC